MFCSKSYSLPNDNFLDWTKFQVFADDKLNVALIMISFFNLLKNIVGKGENGGNAGYGNELQRNTSTR